MPPPGNKTGTDIVVIGGGLIGLSIALEMHSRGARVTVVERGTVLQHASIAAAGMLAADDPHNPAELTPMSRLSVALYPEFLRRVESLSGLSIPFQTEMTMQHADDGSKTRLMERSIDPRQLAAGMARAIRATSMTLLEQTEVVSVMEDAAGVRLLTAGGVAIPCGDVVYAAGAWTSQLGDARQSAVIPVTPRKGQMLRVRLPEGLDLREVHRSEQVYVVPRTIGPQAGTALIGATVEDAGYDTAVRPEALVRLRALAAELIPEMTSELKAPMVEAWAGLRPATPDMLPLLGLRPGSSHQWVAAGHYRNGILLSPATAVLMADMLAGEQPSIDVKAFSLNRFVD